MCFYTFAFSEYIITDISYKHAKQTKLSEVDQSNFEVYENSWCQAGQHYIRGLHQELISKT